MQTKGQHRSQNECQYHINIKIELRSRLNKNKIFHSENFNLLDSYDLRFYSIITILK